MHETLINHDILSVTQFFRITFTLTATKAMNTNIKAQAQEGLQPCYHVFDLIMLNGKVLTNQPLRERLKEMETVVEVEEGRLLLSTHVEAQTW